MSANPHNPGRGRFVAAAAIVVKGSLLAALLSIAAAVFTDLNARIFPQAPWCLVGVAFVCLAAVRWSSQNRALVMPRLRDSAAAPVALTLMAILAGIALVLTGIPSVLNGAVRLPGDRLAGPEHLRNFVSVGLLASAAFIEESGTRGLIQLRLQRVCSPVVAEFVADVIFVAMHAIRLGNPRETLFVSVMSITGGRFTNLTQNTRWCIVVHLGSNLIIAGIILWNRV